MATGPYKLLSGSQVTYPSWINQLSESMHFNCEFRTFLIQTKMLFLQAKLHHTNKATPPFSALKKFSKASEISGSQMGAND